MFEHAYDRSIVRRLVDGIREHGRVAVAHSSIGRLLGVGDRQSAVGLPSPLEAGVANARLSILITPLMSAGQRGRQAVADARVASFGARLRQYVESSMGYRWLTAEPDPDIIIIDLRETRTIGPVIETIDRTSQELTAGMPTSAVTGIVTHLASFGRDRPLRAGSIGILLAVLSSLLAVALAGMASMPVVGLHVLLAVLAGLGLRSTRSLEELCETRVVRTLVAAFEPPEPPTAANASSEPGYGTTPQSDIDEDDDAAETS